jgi:NitT/TauT family transport system ATP-binding protein
VALGSDSLMAERKKINISCIDKSFGSFQVLKEIDFSVAENEFLCVTGPSGCGKTVFLEVVAGLSSPTHGSITMDGEPIDPKKHSIGFVFQQPSCFPWQTLWSEVKFGLDMKGINGEEAAARIRKSIELVGLTGFEKYYPHQLSGGMKQRVAIAKAFVIDPDLLLLDEPFGHLDAQTRYFMQIEILRIWEQMKRTVIFVTNNIEEAVLLGDRVIVLSSIPATIREEIHVKLPRPRDPIDQEFLSIRKKITELYEVGT